MRECRIAASDPASLCSTHYWSNSLPSFVVDCDRSSNAAFRALVSTMTFPMVYFGGVCSALTNWPTVLITPAFYSDNKTAISFDNDPEYMIGTREGTIVILDIHRIFQRAGNP